MMLPVTHSVPTMVSNAINILAAGNTAVFGPHPSGAKVAQYALQLFNREIERECGVANVLTTVREPSIEAAEQIFNHPKIALLCVTGGAAVAKAAAKSGKRVIAGGPGNPPVVVDETADLDRAAKCIIEGAAFDNNLLCIGEKEVFVVASVADKFIDAMRRAGASSWIAPPSSGSPRPHSPLKAAARAARAHVKKEFVGKDVAVLAAAAGVRVPAGTRSSLRRDR
jgi:aldehyde dehydrogenase